MLVSKRGAHIALVSPAEKGHPLASGGFQGEFSYTEKDLQPWNDARLFWLSLPSDLLFLPHGSLARTRTHRKTTRPKGRRKRKGRRSPQGQARRKKSSIRPWRPCSRPALPLKTTRPSSRSMANGAPR